ncbi:hypothetical protein ACFPES_16495, partial [Paenibacillus sp. GCM10023248]|uniref:hypothetical protein n=1 Tax=unclassified Paenibacillus TaxID=185978 RepID=UPI00237915F4
MKFTSLEELLLPVRRRLLQVKGLQFTVRGVTIGLFAGCLWMGLARLLPLSGYRLAAFISMLAAVIASGIWLYVRRPSMADAGYALDRCGLEDRMTTALKYQEVNTLMAVLQRQDAMEKGTPIVESQLKQVIKLHVPMKWLLTLAGMAALLLILVMLPNPQDAVLQRAEQDRAWVEQQKKQAAALAAQLEAKPSPLPAMQQITDDLKELERRLGQTPTTAKALEELAKTLKNLEDRLGELAKQQQRADQWAESMQRKQALRELGKAVAQRSPESIQREASKIAEQVQKMTPEQKQQLASELERLAASAAAASPEAEQQLREQLAQAASALRAGDNAAAQLSRLQAGLAGASAAQEALAAQQAEAAQAAASLAAGALPEARELAASGAAPGQAWAPGGRAEQLAAAGS